MTHVEIKAGATTTPVSTNVYCTDVYLIKNDSADGDLLIKLDGKLLTVKAGEAAEKWDGYSVNTITYESSAGTVNFRFWGLIRDRV